MKKGSKFRCVKCVDLEEEEEEEEELPVAKRPGRTDAQFYVNEGRNNRIRYRCVL